jgi:DNA-binding NarL/FixJ family response regulator
LVGSRKVYEQLPLGTPGTDAWNRLKPTSNPSRAASAVAPYQILIVDDELWAALDMEWVVRKLRHEVVGPAATAEEAIELAGTARPDLVLMDIRLANDSDGVAAAIEIRQRFDIPSLFVSAHGDSATRKRAIAARPEGFIEKPFTPESLALAIEAALKPDAPSD